MPDFVREWFEFLVHAYVSAPEPLQVALATYPIPCALGIYWTQGIKRAQRKRKLGGRANFTSFELRGLSSCISGVLVSLLIKAFYPEAPNVQLLVHMIIGGALAPLLMAWFIAMLSALATRFDWAKVSLQCVKTGDRRKRGGEPPGGVERRDPNETGEFWGN